MSGHRLTPHTLHTEAELRELLGQPSAEVSAKFADRLNPLTRQFIERAPFVCIATADAAGDCDVSPRGDPAGFVRVLDDRTLLIPERRGNRVADTLRNILQNPHVGLLFIVPGVADTFRVNGRATIITDAELLAPSTVNGKAPVLGILVDIEVAFHKCSKAFVRSNFWDPEAFMERSALPSFGEILREILGDPFDAAAYDAKRASRRTDHEQGD